MVLLGVSLALCAVFTVALRTGVHSELPVAQNHSLPSDNDIPLELLHLVREAAAAKRVRGGPRPSPLRDSANVTNRTHSLLASKAGVSTGIVEETEEWKDHNFAVRSKTPPEHSPELMKAISTAEYENLLRSLVNNQVTRFAFNQKESSKAHKFIIDHFKSAGLEVTTQDFDLAFGGFSGKVTNIIGELKGSSKSGEFVVLGAHYDSIPERGNAPGADDNGSGVACMLLAAQAMHKANFKPKRSIRFIAFTAEELGLKGSGAYVKSLSGTEKENFRGAIVLDEVAYSKKKDGEPNVIFETHGREESKQIVIDTMAHATKDIPDWGSKAKFQVNYAGWGSDHMSFIDNGLPAVLLIEKDNLWAADHFGHTARDTLDNIDFKFGADVTAIAAASIGNLADPPTLEA